jgi:hypothetical protein
VNASAASRRRGRLNHSKATATVENLCRESFLPRMMPQRG